MESSSSWKLTCFLWAGLTLAVASDCICVDDFQNIHSDCAPRHALPATSHSLLQQQTGVTVGFGPTLDDDPLQANESLVDAHEELSLLFTMAKRQTFSNNAAMVSLIAIVIFACLATVALLAGLQHLSRKGSEMEERRMIMAAIPSVASMMAMEDAYFTPDLVVPEGCECILFLSSKPRRGQNYDVLDSSGGIVLRVADTDPTNSTLRRKLFSPGNALLAQCVCPHASQQKEVFNFQLLNGNQECWATLRYEERTGGDDKCIIETRLNQTLFLFGTFQHGALNLTDSYGRLLATTGPVTGHLDLLRLRVAPMADVGLAMCGLMCLQAAATAA